MNISGVLVRVRPERLDEVETALAALAGVEIHARTPDGRLIVTVEAAGDRALGDRLIHIQDLPGVLAASMVYHQFEDDARIDEEVSNETHPA